MANYLMKKKTDLLVNASGKANPDLYEDDLIKDTLLSATTIKKHSAI